MFYSQYNQLFFSTGQLSMSILVIIWLFVYFCKKGGLYGGCVPGHPIVCNTRSHNKPLSPYCTETKDWFKYSSRIGQPPVTWRLRQRQGGNLVARSILAMPCGEREAARQQEPPTQPPPPPSTLQHTALQNIIFRHPQVQPPFKSNSYICPPSRGIPPIWNKWKLW